MDPIQRHMRDLYGLNPDIPHMAFQFPRLPPLAGQRLGGPTMPARMDLPDDIARNDILQFRQEFLERAQSLSSGTGPAPPGHPLNGGRRMLNRLLAENERLQKENQDLRKRMATNQDSS